MTTLEAPTDPNTIMLTASSVDEVRRILQLEMIDKAVRAARNGGWCEEFERSMRHIFPDGHPDGGDALWLDSDGFTCRGFDREGFNTAGVDGRGYDREGYRNGYDRHGFNREGFSTYGYDVNGHDRNGFDQNGIHRDGYDLAGNAVDSPEHQDWLYRFDTRGYDADGFNSSGTHRETGLTRAQHANRFRHDQYGQPRPTSE